MMNKMFEVCAKMMGSVTIVAVLSGCSSYTYVRRDSLQRAADPASPYHRDYVGWKEGLLSKEELRMKLPHIALMGDSLSRDFFLSSLPSNAWRLWTKRGRSWFLDTDPSKESIYSIYERIENITPVVAIEYASPGGGVDDGSGGHAIWEPLDFSDQVAALLKEERFPDLVVIWLGHNNVNWVNLVEDEQSGDLEERFETITHDFREKYARQLARVLDGAKKKESRTAIVVFGEINFTAYFQAREGAEALKDQDPSLFPRLEHCYNTFESMKPKYRDNMIRLAKMQNEELRKLVVEFNEGLSGEPQICLQYSDGLSTVDISKVDSIHSVDAWHPSSKGHNELANSAFEGIRPSLEFLGIGK